MASNSAYTSKEGWTTTSASYGSNVGRTSIVSAAKLIEMASELFRIDDKAHILDNGAGTGAVTLNLVSQIKPPPQILATDTSARMLATVSARGLFNVETRVVDALELTKALPLQGFNHVFSTFMLQTLTDPGLAIEEMHKVLKPGGVLGIALWGQRNGPFDIWIEACKSIEPSYESATPFDDPHAWRTPDELNANLHKHGFQSVSTEEITVQFAFDGADAFVDFWFEAKNPAAEKIMSNWTGDMKIVKEAVRKVCREQYNDGKDVKIWAVLGVGRKPA